MRNLYRTALIFLTIFLHGCYTQSDEIYFYDDGTIEFSTDIEYREPLKYKDVDELTDNFVSTLNRAGWTVKKTWILKKPPFSVNFSGEGNIREIDSRIDSFHYLYYISDISQNTYKITIGKGGNKTEFPRAVTFKKSFLKTDAEVLTEGGKKINYKDSFSISKPVTFTVKMKL